MEMQRNQTRGQSYDGLLPASIPLGRITGIPVGLHYSWFVIAALITFSLAAHFRDAHAAWQSATVWGVAVLTALLFFATLLAHELSHALVARRRGLPVHSITLFALGGVASIEKDANTAKTEFLVAIVGPLVSFAIGLSCVGAARSLGWSFDNGTGGLAGSLLGWLGSINVMLAVFNLIPGYPLDGGRVLRAVLWGMYGDQDRATRTAALVGQVVAAIFIAWGLVQFVFGAGLGGLWLAFIGWFLFMAAQASRTNLSIVEALRDIRVSDIMAKDCAVVGPQMTLQGLVDNILLRTGRPCVVVTSDGNGMGLVTARDIGTVDRARWPYLTVREVMRPLDSMRTVEPTTPAAEALTSMLRDDVNQLPVVDNGHMEGIVTRATILQLIQSRSELLQSSR
jgi:Zn-dependent protease